VALADTAAHFAEPGKKPTWLTWIAGRSAKADRGGATTSCTGAVPQACSRLANSSAAALRGKNFKR
jgi:hypothetical protein